MQRAAQQVFVQRLMELGANESASSDVRAIAQHFVGRLPALLFPAGGTPRSAAWGAHIEAVADVVKRYKERPFSPYAPQKPLPVPAGDPIGQP